MTEAILQTVVITLLTLYIVVSVVGAVVLIWKGSATAALPEYQECPACGEIAYHCIGQVDVEVGLIPKGLRRHVQEWQCMECNHYATTNVR
jgi:hypothetical protein